MSDDRDTPKLQPPPRVPAAGRAGAGSKSGPDFTSTGRRLVWAAVFAAMALGLIGVFVLLPRWQERREERPIAGREVREAAPTAAVPAPAAPIPVPTAANTVSEPSQVSTRTQTPGRIRPPNTPNRQPTSDQLQYVEAMSEGLAALENGEWQAAQAAFERASRLRPDAPEVADGMARARAGQRRDVVADSLRRARELEQHEAWLEAEKMYETVLAVDPESAAALAGKRTTQMRADLDEKLEFHLANPGRLSTAEVFEDAATCLAEARETVPSGPRMESQIARLELLLEQASTPVAVVLESDALTEVVVYRVGRLGTFSRRELALKPGAYTVVGSRAGYRDVRLQLVVTPGARPKPLLVQCTERL